MSSTENLTDGLFEAPLADCWLVAPPTSVPSAERRDYGNSRNIYLARSVMRHLSGAASAPRFLGVSPSLKEPGG